MNTHARSIVLFFGSVVLAASGCGGKDFGPGGSGDDGGASSSGGGSSGGGSGGSSSSGGGSSSSGGGCFGPGCGSSSGGGRCPANPPSGSCSNDGKQCSYGNECSGTTCDCSSGQWVCSGFASSCPAETCPTTPPMPGTSCPSVPPCCAAGALLCNYGTDAGCGGEQCQCQNGQWLCSVGGCPPPPSCPPSPPQGASFCPVPNQDCSYTSDAGCWGEDCVCQNAGWSCSAWECAGEGGVIDGGAAGGD